MKVLESYSAQDDARREVLVFYRAACERAAVVDANPDVQIDPRLPVPNYIAEFSRASA